MATPLPRLLLVDDEPAVLEGLKLHLRRHFATTTAGGGAEALAILAQAEPFAVVMSDMRMPGMNGATLLAKARVLAPDTVRLLLTGFADMDSAIAAVNEGQIFRFLSKPCAPEALLANLTAANEQHRLITAERVLLEQTLHGSIKALTDLLAVAQPAAFGRAGRAKVHVARMCAAIPVADRWPIEVAAMLSQIGCITLPTAVVDRYYLGEVLADADQRMIDQLPALACQLLGAIPRLEPVREILAAMDRRYENPTRGALIPLGARMLKLALDHDLLEARGLDAPARIATLRGRFGWYDPALLEAWIALVGSAAASTEIRELKVADLRVGMVFVEDVRARTGTLLIARGNEATPGVLGRLRNFGASVGVIEPVRVRLPKEI